MWDFYNSLKCKLIQRVDVIYLVFKLVFVLKGFEDPKHTLEEQKSFLIGLMKKNHHKSSVD